MLLKSRYFLLIAMLALSVWPASAEVYRWVDQAGNVHYSDRPGAESAAKVAVRSNPTDQGRITQRKQQRVEASQAETAAETAALAEQEKQSENDARLAENCRRATAALTSLENTQRLYVTDADGERQYLSDQERAVRIDEARKSVDKWCNEQD